MARKKVQSQSPQVSFGDVVERVRWAMDVRLEFIIAVALDPQTFQPDALGLEEELERWRTARVREGREGVDTKLLIATQDEVLVWWKDYSESDLLTALAQRYERRKAKRGPADGRREPSQAEGMKIARPLLGDVAKKSGFSFDHEAEAVSVVVAALYLPPFIEYNKDSFRTLHDAIELAKASCVYFDALCICYAEYQKRGMQPPVELYRWHQQVAAGRLRRPKRNKLPRGRQSIVVQLLRDLQVQFVVELLSMLGIPRSGRDRSGFRIAADVLTETLGPSEGISEWNIESFWKERFGTKRSAERLGGQSEAIANRTGPFHNAPVSDR